MSLNVVCLIGNLTRDPEVKYTPQGKTVVNFGIAVNRVTKNDSGDYDVDFFNIVAWEKTAEFVSNYVKKGNKIALQGRLQQRQWTTDEGQNRSVVEIVAAQVQSLTPREDNGEGEPAGQRAQAQAQKTTRSSQRQPPKPSEIEDESDPFADD